MKITRYNAQIHLSLQIINAEHILLGAGPVGVYPTSTVFAIDWKETFASQNFQAGYLSWVNFKQSRSILAVLAAGSIFFSSIAEYRSLGPSMLT